MIIVGVGFGFDRIQRHRARDEENERAHPTSSSSLSLSAIILFKKASNLLVIECFVPANIEVQRSALGDHASML